MLPLAAMPSPPCNAAPRSVMISPNRLFVTITSNWLGSRTICAHRASTYMCWDLISGYSAACVGHGVGFVTKQYAGTGAAVGFLGVNRTFEGVADYPANAFVGVDILLD